MTGGGRPLRFLGAVAGTWVALRVAIVWQATGSLPQAIRGVLPVARAEAPGALPVASAVRPGVAGPEPVARRIAAAPRAPRPAPVADPIRVQMALAAMTRFGDAVVVGAAPDQTAPPGTPSAIVARPQSIGLAAPRWSVSSWAIARGGVGIGASPDAPQLGGAQGGVRVDYAIGRGLAATGRLAVPAAGAGREVSLGVAWRPAGLPVRFVAEHRFALDRGGSGPALGVSGGVSARPLPMGFALDGYAQAGAILRRGIEHYADGSVRAARPITAAGPVVLDAGGGLWGGLQRGVARLEVGPSLGTRLPVAGRAVRLSLDWRQRIAGNARPGSGPALTVGTDF